MPPPTPASLSARLPDRRELVTVRRPDRVLLLRPPPCSASLRVMTLLVTSALPKLLIPAPSVPTFAVTVIVFANRRPASRTSIPPPPSGSGPGAWPFVIVSERTVSSPPDSISRIRKSGVDEAAERVTVAPLPSIVIADRIGGSPSSVPAWADASVYRQPRV